MRFITVRDLRTSPAKIWKTLPEEKEMVITNNGRPIALLTPITDGNFEETIVSFIDSPCPDRLLFLYEHSCELDYKAYLR